MGVRVCGAAAKSVVLTGLVELITVKVALIEIEMATVLQTEVGTAGEHQRKIGVAVTVAIPTALPGVTLPEDDPMLTAAPEFETDQVNPEQETVLP